MLSRKSHNVQKSSLDIYLYPRNLFCSYHHFCALWHCLISNNDQCETSSFIQTNTLILSIFDYLICSLSPKMSHTALNPQSSLTICFRYIYNYSMILSCTWKISTLNVTEHHSRHKSDSPQSSLAVCSAVTHGWPQFYMPHFNQIVPDTEEPQELLPFACFCLHFHHI